MVSSYVPRCLAIASLVLAVGSGPVRSAEPSGTVPAIMVAEFSYIDTSGEPADQSAAHRRRLQAFMAALRSELAADQHVRLVDPSCAPRCIADATATDVLRHAAIEAGARVMVIGGIQKMSTLVQWARTAVVEVASNRVMSEKLYTFRGDDDEAWHHAEAFVSRDIRDALTAPPVVRLALFPFELEDESGGADLVGATESDIKGLSDATDAVRQLLERSGRYQLVEFDPSSSEVRALHDCADCDARLAAQLGAEQSLVGVVRRISRAEYTIRFQVRTAGTGAVIAAGDSGLRMGANYSWGRGAVRLVQDRLLDASTPKP